MTPILSDRVRASSWSWVTIIAVLPCSFRSFRSCWVSCLRKVLSRLEKGSSIRISFGLGARALAMAIRCCWPPESWWM